MQTGTLTEKHDAITEGLGRMYDVAINHAIETVRREYMPGQPLLNSTLDKIITTLKALKK